MDSQTLCDLSPSCQVSLLSLPSSSLLYPPLWPPCLPAIIKSCTTCLYLRAFVYSMVFPLPTESFSINVHNSLQCLLPIFAQMKLLQCGPPDTLLIMTDHPSPTQLIVLLQHPLKGLGIPSCTLFSVLHLSLSFGTQAYSCFLFLLIRHKCLKQYLMYSKWMMLNDKIITLFNMFIQITKW